MKQIITFAVFVLLLAACEDGSKKQIEALKKETMDVHDEAMKDLADMNRVSRKLKDFLTTATMTPEQSEQFTTTLAAIEKADDDMTAWMSAYEEPKGAPAAEVIRYLEDQKQKISKNRDDIRAALEAGKKLLEPFEQIEALKKQTMNVHDEAMKDLAEMNRVSRKLKDFLTTATMTPEQSKKFTAALTAIEKADDDMTAWMSAYKEPEGVPPAEAMRYWQEQKQKMEKIRDDIRAALATGKKLLPQPGQ